MVRQRVNHWSSDRSPEDAGLALLALGLVPKQLRTAEATASQILAGLREVLASPERPAHWTLGAGHHSAEGWESIVAVEDLAAAVREVLPEGRLVQIECDDPLDPADTLDFFEHECECAGLRANGWTFETVRTPC